MRLGLCSMEQKEKINSVDFFLRASLSRNLILKIRVNTKIPYFSKITLYLSKYVKFSVNSKCISSLGIIYNGISAGGFALWEHKEKINLVDFRLRA